MEEERFALVRAAKRSQWDEVHRLIDAGVSQEQLITQAVPDNGNSCYQRHTALHIAIILGQNEIAKRLIDLCPAEVFTISIGMSFTSKETTVTLALPHGDASLVCPQLEKLHEAGLLEDELKHTHSGIVSNRHMTAQLPQLIACTGVVAMAETLLDNCPSALFAPAPNTSMFHYAAKGNHAEMVHFLASRMDDEAIVARTNPNGFTALHIAVSHAAGDAVIALLEIAPRLASELSEAPHSCAPISIVGPLRSLEAARKLLEMTPPELMTSARWKGNNVMHSIAMNKNMKLAELAVQYVPSLCFTQTDGNGMTPLDVLNAAKRPAAPAALKKLFRAAAEPKAKAATA